ncbi:MAG: hypothetical protein LBQ13_02770 [Endomicrobium sp.]|jgi:hypothetical protein|nr:hypothetical protein [Endomicrobium sp.]
MELILLLVSLCLLILIWVKSTDIKKWFDDNLGKGWFWGTLIVVLGIFEGIFVYCVNPLFLCLFVVIMCLFFLVWFPIKKRFTLTKQLKVFAKLLKRLGCNSNCRRIVRNYFNAKGAKCIAKNTLYSLCSLRLKNNHLKFTPFLRIVLWLVNLIVFVVCYGYVKQNSTLNLDLFWSYTYIAIFIGLLLISISLVNKKNFESKYNEYYWLIWIIVTIVYAISIYTIYKHIEESIFNNIKMEETFLLYCFSAVVSLLILILLIRFVVKSIVLEKDEEGEEKKLIPLHIDLDELKKYFGTKTWIGKVEPNGKKKLENGTQKTRRIFLYTWIWVFVLFIIMCLVLCIKGCIEQSVDINTGVLNLELKFDTIPDKKGTLATFVPQTTPYDSANFITRTREKSDSLLVSLNVKLSFYDSSKIDSLSTFMYVYENSDTIDTVFASQELKFFIKIDSKLFNDTLVLNNANNFKDSIKITDANVLKNKWFRYNKKSYLIQIGKQKQEERKKREKFEIKPLKCHRWWGIASEGLDMLMNVLLLILFATLHIRTKVFDKERHANSYTWIGTFVFFAFGLIMALNIVNIFILNKKEIDFLIDIVIAVFSVIAIFGIWGRLNNHYTKIDSLSKLILFIYATAQIFAVFRDRKIEMFWALQIISIAGRITILYEIVHLFSKKKIAWYYINEANEARTEKSLEEFQDIFKENEDKNQKIQNKI